MKPPSETGFAGLQTLVSDVEPALREADRRKRDSTAQASPASSSSAAGAAPAQPSVTESPRRQAPKKSPRWGRLAAAVAAIVVIVLIIQDSETPSSGSTYYSGTPSASPTPSATTPPAVGNPGGSPEFVFTGRATNRGYPTAPSPRPLSARIVLTVPEHEGATGHLAIDPPLGGAGRANFRRWADSVLFISISASGDTIAWLGRAVQSGYAGSYRIMGGQYDGQWGDWTFAQTAGTPISTLPLAKRPFPDSVDIVRVLGLTAGTSVPVEDGLNERRPVAGGGDRLLDPPEIRFCLAEEIRIEAAEAVLDATSEWQIDRFNEHVASYNRLCGRYRYRSGALETARREVERHRARLVREGRAWMVRSSGSRTTTPSGGDAERELAAQPRAVQRRQSLSRSSSPGQSTSPRENASVASKNTSGNATTDLRNVATCLSGNYPALCKHDLLSPEQLSQVRQAERTANYRTCASGQYPALCKHDLLTPTELQEVEDAERAANFRTCSSGQYPVLCKHHLLTAAQLRTVEEAERAANYRTCASGRYPSLCKHHMLTAEQLAEVTAAEADANYRTCASGRYPSLCKHHLLTPLQLEEVRAAEHRVNLQTCLQGRYPTLCKRDLLSADEIARVDAAERRARRP